MFLISLSIHMTSIFIFSLIHVLNNNKNLDKMSVIFSIVLICVISLLFIPIFGLTGFHMVLVSRGRTTNEQVTGKFRGGYNPFSKGCVHNCCNTLCGPQYPSLKHPTKYIGKKARKYVIPAKPLTPLHLQAMVGTNDVQAPSSEVQMYRDLSSGGLHGTPYNKMTAINNKDGDEGSDMDEPMASQSIDSEAPLTHNTSKSNFFTLPDDSGNAGIINQRVNAIQSRDSPQSKYNPQYAKGSPHPGQREASVTDGGKFMDMQNPANYQSPMAKKVGKMGGIPTPLAGVANVPSPNRYASAVSQQQPGRTEYVQMKEQKPQQYHGYQVQHFHGGEAEAIVTDPNTGLQTTVRTPVTTAYDQMQRYQQLVTSPNKRYMSDGELLENVTSAPEQMGSTVISASHLTDVINSPQGNYYLWKDPGAPSQEMQHSYASQVGYYLQQSQQRLPPQQQLNQAQAVIQSGGPRTTPSGYPGGPIVPSGQLSPQHSGRPNQALNIGYSTTGRMSVHQTHQPQPVTFTRALEMSKSIGQSLNEPNASEMAIQQQRMQAASSGPDIKMQPVKQGSQEQQGGRRDSVYDMNSYEISV